MRVGVFEDEAYENLLPLTLTRPTYELKAGTTTMLEKILRLFKNKDETEDKAVLFCRKYLEEMVREKHGYAEVNEFNTSEEVLLVNGLLIPRGGVEEALAKLTTSDTALVVGGRVAAARLRRKTLEKNELYKALTNPSKISKAILRNVDRKIELCGVSLIEYPWELLEVNSVLVAEEFTKGEWEGEVDEGATVYGDRNRVYVGRGAFVEAGVVLDARGGPIYLGEGVQVQAFSRIAGPAYVGRGSILFGAQLRGGCSIGEVCRVGGEVEETIIHAYSNKRHYGYIGHAYVGEWVNLGAGTTNSNLKNTYGTVKMFVRGERRDTGRIFVGCFIGDHAKAAIGTLIYSGKKIGVSSHVYGAVIEDVPSFTAYAKSLGGGLVEIFPDSAVETARRVMKRRKVEMTDAYEAMLRRVFKLTQRERRTSDVRKGRLRL